MQGYYRGYKPEPMQLHSGQRLGGKNLIIWFLS